MSKFDGIFLVPCKSPELVFHYNEILETKGAAFLFSFQYTCVVITPSLFKMIFVSKIFSRFTSIVNFMFG